MEGSRGWATGVGVVGGMVKKEVELGLELELELEGG
jgi:hypothetical protein